MKRSVLMMTALAVSLLVMACGNGNSGNISESVESAQKEQTIAEKISIENTESEAAETDGQKDAVAETDRQESKAVEADKDERLDNFEVEQDAVIEYAEKIKTAVAEKDIEKLADLVSYPTYFGFPDKGVIIQNKEEFIALDQKKVFTEEMLSSIEAADAAALKASMAGFTLTKGSEEGMPSITFSMTGGKLGITGINY